MSKDGNWRSFPKIPNLLQYISSENFYCRVKVNGKIYRESPKVSCFRACFSEVATLEMAATLERALRSSKAALSDVSNWFLNE